MRDHIVLYVNGSRREISADDAFQTLSEFLRNQLHPPQSERFTGTKIACEEGDCGACTVLVGSLDVDNTTMQYRSVDACIAFLFQLDSKHIVTVEGLRVAGGLTDVQQAMVDCHGSQCGFCTPGFVMALHGAVEELRTPDCESTSLEEQQIRLALSGNLCRCTGYLQILEAAASLDLNAVPSMQRLFDSAAMLDDVRKLVTESVLLNSGGEGAGSRAIAIPKNRMDLLAFRSNLPDARLVAGATDVGVQRNHGKQLPPQVITTNQIAELQTVSIDDEQLIVGAAATWQQIEKCIAGRLPEYHSVLQRFGSPQIRHMGTLVGNLANASPIADSIPFHLVAESTIEVASEQGTRDIAIGDFYQGYKQLALQSNEVITRVRTPMPSEAAVVKLYKISKRRDMDISAVTAAFWLELDGERIVTARVALGGVGPVVVRLEEAEALLKGQKFSLENMRHAGSVARDEVKPISDVRGSADYRSQIVENLFSKCFHDVSNNLIAQVS